VSLPDLARRPRVLTVAGSDSSGGAGVQGDLKTIMALGGHGCCAITAVTAQHSRGVTGWWPVPPHVLRAQLDAVLTDAGVDAIKVGMLGTAEAAECLADVLVPVVAAGTPLVIDPVLAAGTGHGLAEPGVLRVLRERLVPLASVLTPNLDEVRALTGFVVETDAQLRPAAATLLALGPGWVLVKGGHLPGEATDLLTNGTEEHVLSAPRLANRNTHGTGCALATAIATNLAAGVSVPDAARAAKDYVFGALAAGYALGAGAGPIDHGWQMRSAGGGVPRRGPSG